MRVITCRGVSTNVMNLKKQAPLHLVTELNKVKVLETMSRYKSLIDTRQGGEHGRTALHIAAIHDHDECARILVSLNPNSSATYLILIISLMQKRQYKNRYRQIISHSHHTSLI